MIFYHVISVICIIKPKSIIQNQEREKLMKNLLITIALALPLLTACVHHHDRYGHDKHRDGPGNSENAPGHNKDKNNKHDH